MANQDQLAIKASQEVLEIQVSPVQLDLLVSRAIEETPVLPVKMVTLVSQALKALRAILDNLVHRDHQEAMDNLDLLVQ